jgi:predicted nucleic-acid-binding Zn-ribbon protein
MMNKCPKCGGVFVDAIDKAENKRFFLATVDMSRPEPRVFVQKGVPLISKMCASCGYLELYMDHKLMNDRPTK